MYRAGEVAVLKGDLRVAIAQWGNYKHKKPCCGGTMSLSAAHAIGMRNWAAEDSDSSEEARAVDYGGDTVYRRAHAKVSPRSDGAPGLAKRSGQFHYEVVLDEISFGFGNDSTRYSRD